MNSLIFVNISNCWHSYFQFMLLVFGCKLFMTLFCFLCTFVYIKDCAPQLIYGMDIINSSILLKFCDKNSSGLLSNLLFADLIYHN